jgi:hypothetical protein
MKKIEERDYSYLENRVIDFISDIAIIYIAKVVCVDYNVGITIVFAEDTEWVLYDQNNNIIRTDFMRANIDEIYCLNGEYSPHGKDKFYKIKFASTVQQIKRGKFFYKKIDNINKSVFKNYKYLKFDVSPCPYK